jgi:hypothetical protein
MGVLKLAGLTGMWPQRDPRALPDNAAVYAENIRVDGGQYLRGVSGATVVKALAGATQTVYRIPLPGANTLVNSYWMEFADIDTDVVRGPLVNDSFKRYYWASPSTGLKFAPQSDIIAGSSGYESGVEAPVTALTAVVVGGTGEIVDGENVAPEETRVYTVTFINEYGEESQPGPTTEVVGHADQHYLLTAIPQPPAPAGEADYDTIRIYRTVSGVTGNTGFYKVVDLAVGTTFYTDEFSHTVVTGQTQLESTLWARAPALQGLVAMPNGIFAGWVDNNVYFSENWRPHAWPPEYLITTDFPIVGMGVFGNTLVVVTTGNPYAISGVKSNAMSMTKIGQPLPGLSRRSIVSSPEGVYWATESGLAYVGPGGADVVTAGLISREDWQEQYNPSGLRSMYINGQYVASCTLHAWQYGFVFAPTNPTVNGLSWWSQEVGLENIGVEPWTGKPWGIGDNNNLYELRVPGEDPLPWTWVSKEFVYPKPVNFQVFQCFFDDTTGDTLYLKVKVTLRGSDGAVTNDALVYDQVVTQSGKELRLPSGFKSDVWQLEFTGTCVLQSFVMASSVAELRSV